MSSIREQREALLRRPDLHGSGRRTALTSLTDDWLAELFAVATDGAPGFCLVAVGSHGRRELAPGSDLDVILVHRADQQAAAQVAERLWYPIWDSGLRLDHSVRTVAESRRMASQDLKVALGLMDGRPLCGELELGDGLVSSVLADWRAMAPRRLPELRAIVDERRQRFGDLHALLAPDLKESYGGLREATVLRAIAASWVTDIPHDRWPQDVQFLLDVRDALHLQTGRSSDVLVQQEQQAVAAGLDIADRDDLLRRVFDAARSIAYASDVSWYRVSRLTRSTPRLSFRSVSRSGRTAERIPLAEGVVAQSGEVVLAHDADPANDPVLVLRCASAAAQAGLPIAPHAVARLAEESAPLPQPWPRSAREAFVSLLGSGASMVDVWEALDQAGIINRLIPEWSVVRSAPQRDPLHRFTVDRHLVECVVQASSLTRRVDRPDLLLVGALLHDIGKARGGDHSVVGEVIASQVATGLGFDQAEVAVICQLVRWHLLLADIATRRDLDDPATIQEVTGRIGDAEVLTLLHVLTEADSHATNTGLWNDWRAHLVADLVSRCHSVLSGAALPAPPRLSDDQRVLLRSPGVWARVDVGTDDVRLTVGAPDRIGLLAVVAGLLSMHRLQVRSARVVTEADRAMQEWTVRPLFGDPPQVEVFVEDLRRALDGRLDIAGRLAERDAAYAPPPGVFPSPVVSIESDGAHRTTILQVRAHDAPGLLYRISTAVAQAGASIDGAKVSTLGSEVVDVFFLTDRLGQPLSVQHAAAVRSTVQGAMDEQVA